jgi:hypothetical protein
MSEAEVEPCPRNRTKGLTGVGCQGAVSASDRRIQMMKLKRDALSLFDQLRPGRSCAKVVNDRVNGGPGARWRNMSPKNLIEYLINSYVDV